MGNIIEYNNKHTRTRTTVLGIESEGVSRQSFFFSFSFKNQKLWQLFFFLALVIHIFFPPSPAEKKIEINKFKKKMLILVSPIFFSQNLNILIVSDGTMESTYIKNKYTSVLESERTTKNQMKQNKKKCKSNSSEKFPFRPPPKKKRILD